MMLVVSAITALGLYVAQRKLAAEASLDLQHQFQSKLAALHTLQEVRHAALAERCRALVQKPRIHAALEDNALDLLYPSAKDELRDILDQNAARVEPASHTLHAQFYRFLELNGGVNQPADTEDAGELSPAEEAQLALKSVPREQQLGYLARTAGASIDTVAEIIAVPGVLAYGATEKEAIASAQALAFRVLADRIEQEKEPTDAVTVSIEAS